MKIAEFLKSYAEQVFTLVITYVVPGTAYVQEMNPVDGSIQSGLLRFAVV